VTGAGAWLTCWLAQGAPKGPEFGGSSPIGLVVTLLMLIAVAILIRSMNKHLRNLPKSFDQPEQSDAPTERSGGAPKAAPSTDTPDK
jgi:hypothetical protein